MLTCHLDTFPPLRAKVHYEWVEHTSGSLSDDIQEIFEVADDNDDSDIEIVKEYVRAALPLPRVFAVPDSDMSAAGSFISDDDESDQEEIDTYLPSSARTMMREFNPNTESNVVEPTPPQPPKEQQVAGIEAGIVPETIPQSVSSPGHEDTLESGLTQVEHVVHHVQSENQHNDENAAGIDTNLTETDSESDYSEDQPLFNSDSLGSD